MTAKEKQNVFIKPQLKIAGYQISGQTWWKEKEEFFTVINLQNFSWNDKDNVDFCFNIGIALKANLRDKEKEKPTAHDLTVYLREGFYLPKERKENGFRNKSGYILKTEMDFEEFAEEIVSDFSNHILPYLEGINTPKDCISHFGEITFWGENLKRVIRENNIVVA